MRVSELMHTPAVTCAPTTTIREVGQLMEQRHVGSVVVIDQVGEVAGIVTDRDIVLRGVAQGRSGDVPVDTVMTRNVATIDPRAVSSPRWHRAHWRGRRAAACSA